MVMTVTTKQMRLVTIHDYNFSCCTLSPHLSVIDTVYDLQGEIQNAPEENNELFVDAILPQDQVGVTDI